MAPMRSIWPTGVETPKVTSFISFSRSSRILSTSRMVCQETIIPPAQNLRISIIHAVEVSDDGNTKVRGAETVSAPAFKLQQLTHIN